MENIRYNTSEELTQKVADDKNGIKQLFSKLQKKRPKNLDATVHRLHDDAFGQFDCLACANCCKTISPIITDKDIERLAKHLKVKPADFTRQHLRIDNDGDYVFNISPCPFLMPDNYCTVYEQRPKACREYPHTNRKRFYQLLKLSLKNCEVCPVVFEIAQKLKKIYQ